MAFVLKGFLYSRVLDFGFGSATKYSDEIKGGLVLFALDKLMVL